MTMTLIEASRVVNLIEEVAKLAAQVVRCPPGHPGRAGLEELLAARKAELVEALRVS